MERGYPAELKIKEIEKGLTTDFIQTVRDPLEIQNLGFSLVKSARDEILIIFSTVNAFHRQEQEW